MKNLFCLLSFCLMALPAFAQDALPAKISLIASRSSGVAPLSVFFETEGTKAVQSAARPFHDLEYLWNFGDAQGEWAYGARAGTSSRNLATGPVTSHVFETPGVYVVTLKINDGKNTAIAKASITVTDPNDPLGPFSGKATICISSSSLPIAGVDGCPAGARTLQEASFTDAIDSSQSKSKRILFRRGDRFSSEEKASVYTNGPGIIGVYGTGNIPIVFATGDHPILSIGSLSSSTINDWRVMDLALDGQSNPGSIGIIGVNGASQITALRVHAYDMHSGFLFNLSGLNSNKRKKPYLTPSVHDQITIADSSIKKMLGGAAGNGAFLIANRLSLLGSSIDDTTKGEHGIRIQYVGKGVISNNTFKNASEHKHLLTVRAGPFEGSANFPSGAYSEQVVISDNKFIGGASAWSMTIAPQNTSRDERIRDIILERNWFLAGAGTRLALRIEASEVTVRNNICNASGGAVHGCFAVAYANTTGNPAPDQIRFYHNTAFSTDAANNFVAIGISGKSPMEMPSNVTIKNNLGYAPNDTRHALLDTSRCEGICRTTLVHEGNSTDSEVGGTAKNSRVFISEAPTNPSDFALSPGSYANGKGVMVPVFTGFFGNTISTRNIGAQLN